jgi:uncharacterized membrane protein (UPF0127 family)
MKRKILAYSLIALGLLALAVAWVFYQDRQPQAMLPAIAVQVGDKIIIQAELAVTTGQRERGLMFRQALAPDAGMLFIYPADRELRFWMKNTSIPLSVAFLDHQGRILNMADMQPHDETLHRSAGPACCALEVNQGWFARNGIQTGDRIRYTLPEQIAIH